MNDGVRLSAHRALEGLVVILSVDEAKMLMAILTTAVDTITAAQQRKARR